MPASLYDRLVALPRPEPGKATLPPVEIIAFNVHVRRKLHGWKQSTLASLADVSLSTIERIERGEPVQPALMEKVGAAFGYPPGYYTAPRTPLTQEEVAQQYDGHTVFVSVEPFAKQLQFRRIARCMHLVFAPIGDCPNDQPQLLKLFELLSELTVRLALPTLAPRSRLGGVRPLYQAITNQIALLRRAGIALVCGVLHEPERDPQRYAVIAAGHLAVDPGIQTRKLLILDRREVTGTWETESLD
ncbi:MULTISPECIES: helix-turn-helix domain-containing protein [Caulobacter]|jgi:transcriptional regulator with XRE-family HTH domain|uniref:helix-turn-helix domain-containing protein n=1 Tax=Caulobacter TaxID=75 RepID=UPI00103A86DF|nr:MULTISPECIES: helix-turn-helix transcriptional regulator [Caulobacter]